MRWKVTGLFLLSLICMAVLIMAINLAVLSYFLGPGGRASDEGGKSRLLISDYIRDFQRYIVFERGVPGLSEEGKRTADEYRFWIQILNPNGDEVYSYRRPDSALKHYTPGEMVHYYKYDGSLPGTSLYVSWIEREKVKWTYLVGLPVERNAKYVAYFSPWRLRNFWLQGLLTVLGATLLIALLIGYGSARWLTRPFIRIIEGIKGLASGNYDSSYPERGLYRDIYRSLNEVSEGLQKNERRREQLEAMREQWITGLSHDIKTPLSSVKGYAEVLADSDYEVEKDERIAYASVIVSKANYMETLLDDLRLTYQLQHDVLPLKRVHGNLTELLRNVVIELLNTPGYEDRDVHFMTEGEVMPLVYDEVFLRRAFSNLIYNAIIHNPEQTRVEISLTLESKSVMVKIADNGNGIAEEEMEHLFNRYYRGTNTSEQHQGSGLGMAIARQIIEAHKGSIEVTSQPRHGTTMVVRFPALRRGSQSEA